MNASESAAVSTPLTIVVGVTGGIAAYKAVSVIRSFVLLGHDVHVIAVDQTLRAGGQPQAAQRGLLATEARVPKAVTFEMSEADAERLFVAGQLGRLQLAVRPLEITQVAEVVRPGRARAMWASDVSPALRSLPRPQAAQPASPVEASIRRPPVEIDDRRELRP